MIIPDLRIYEHGICVDIHSIRANFISVVLLFVAPDIVIRQVQRQRCRRDVLDKVNSPDISNDDVIFNANLEIPIRPDPCAVVVDDGVVMYAFYLRGLQTDSILLIAIDLIS